MKRAFLLAPLLLGAVCEKKAPPVVDSGVVDALTLDPSAEKLAQLVDKATRGFTCPEGTTRVGEEPPDGKEIWCEKDGARHGPYRAWHDNGLKALDGAYKDGKREGPFIEWHANGERKSEATYVEDKPHGRYRIWSEEGEVVSDVDYNRGKVR